MRMDTQTVGLLVFLALIKNLSTRQPSVPFTLTPRELTAKEGSCVEINCQVIHSLDDYGAYWFWIKDAAWIHADYKGTVIYSTNNITHSVSQDFVNRVKYVGSSSLYWKEAASSPQPLCGIFICNLKKADSGHYSLRFVGKSKKDTWIVKDNVTLTVEENRCPLTFETPSAVNDSETITLKCSTSPSCPSVPKIEVLTKPLPTPPPGKTVKNKETTVSFKASWENDGMVFSCQIENNIDKYLIRNISVTVEYAPKDIQTNNITTVKEGDPVTLNCSAKGSPRPTFSWFKREEIQSSEAQWTITSIEDSHSGEYYCQAENRYGKIKSKSFQINVTYVPHVEIKVTSPMSEFKQGDQMNLKCNVMRSNPNPGSYTWLKDGKIVDQNQTYVKEIEPEDSGSYTCEATNSAGPGKSEPLLIEVQYKPRKTGISILGLPSSMKAGQSLSFTCDTDANPPPKTFSWYRYSKNKEMNPLQWTSTMLHEKILHFDSLQRTDEACYMCNATNEIDTGDNSEEQCIHVMYPPTKLILSMAAEVTEDQRITINCTVESFPESTLTLKETSKSGHQPLEMGPHDSYRKDLNMLHVTLIATSARAGFYTCHAENTEGSEESNERKLVVKYSPKNVVVKAGPSFDVKENMSLTLYCDAKSHSPLTAVTWMIVGKDKIIQNTSNFIIKSVSPSDSGLYSCEARNEIGTGTSQQVEVRVKYAPKNTSISISAKKQQRDGKSYVTLTCRSHSYPQVNHYSWYKKKEVERDDKMADGQNFTVYSDQPGDYYCIAKNEINQKRSDPVSLFKGDFLRFLKFFFLSLIILLIIFSIILFYRHRKKKTIEQRITNSEPLFGFLDWWNGTMRGNLMSETVLAEPSRSRDDLLPDQPYRPTAQRCQPPPDSTPASNINSVYSTVNQPHGKQAPTAQKLTRQQGGHTGDGSLNYASLHFENKPKNKQVKIEEDTVYAQVSKPEPPKKNEERLEDYENIRLAHAPRSSIPLNDDRDTDTDTDTSDDDVEVNYSQVSFTAKPGRQRADSDSTSSDDDGIQYSDVKI